MDLPTTDPAEITDLLSRMIVRLKDCPEALSALSGTPGTIRIRLTDPDVDLRLNLAGDETFMGPNEAGDDGSYDTTISMRWETAHGFWAGSLDLMSALMMGTVKIEGSNLDPLFRLKSLLTPAREIYLELVREYGDKDRSK